MNSSYHIFTNSDFSNGTKFYKFENTCDDTIGKNEQQIKCIRDNLNSYHYTIKNNHRQKKHILLKHIHYCYKINLHVNNGETENIKIKKITTWLKNHTSKLKTLDLTASHLNPLDHQKNLALINSVCDLQVLEELNITIEDSNFNISRKQLVDKLTTDIAKCNQLQKITFSIFEKQYDGKQIGLFFTSLSKMTNIKEIIVKKLPQFIQNNDEKKYLLMALQK